ncbi:MAG: response regulator [Phycisphaerae bacterium]|nr:response regulator [Phycisphaerae bacterium]
MSTYTLILVDDDAKVLSSLKRMFTLAQTPYTCFFAASAKEAYDIATRRKIDLILTDYQMPRESGVDLIRKVSRLYPDVVCMILSGKTDFTMAVEIINQAVVHKFIAKPWNDAELLQTIAGALRERDLTRENRNLRMQMKKMMQVIQEMESSHPGITKLERDIDGAIIID